MVRFPDGDDAETTIVEQNGGDLERAELLEARADNAERDRAIEDEMGTIETTFTSANLSYLEKAALAKKYRDLYIQRLPQVEENKRRGRPGVVLAMARKLAVPGETPKARENWLWRALKIAEMEQQVKELAKEAKLDRNQSALLKIAKLDGADAQLEALAQLKQSREVPVCRRRPLAKATIRFEAQRRQEVMKKLAEFAETLGVEVL